MSPTKTPSLTVRARVLEAIVRYPGIHVRGLERQMQESAPLIQYHLKRLHADGYVENREQGGYVRYYPTPKAKTARIAPADQPLLGILREEVPLHIALLLLDHGPLTHGDIVQRVGVAKSTLSYHLAKMAEAGLIDRVPGATTIRLTDRDRIYALLLAHKPTPDLLDAFAELWDDLYSP